MKKAVFILVPLLFFAILTPVYADTSEKVTVVKFDKKTNDMIVERATGERLLIRYNRVCGSMTTQFPVNLIWKGDVLKEVKVAPNERCRVYDFGPYTGDVTIDSRTKSPNRLIVDHIAELTWKGNEYRIDYGKGCRNLRLFLGKIAYLNAPEGVLGGATLYLPQNQGECTINSASYLGESDDPRFDMDTLKNIQHKAENNEAYFHWDDIPGEKKWIYLISRSKRPLDTTDYHYRQMPYLRFSTSNSYTAKYLKNGQQYYFYFSVRDSNGNAAPWVEVKVKPVQTIAKLMNNADFDAFEIEVAKETDDYFLLRWPDKSEDSRRYMIQLFVNGKRKLFKLIDAAVPEFKVEKKPEYDGARFRFTVRSIAKSRYGERHNDSIFWRVAPKK